MELLILLSVCCELLLLVLSECRLNSSSCNYLADLSVIIHAYLNFFSLAVSSAIQIKARDYPNVLVTGGLHGESVSLFTS